MMTRKLVFVMVLVLVSMEQCLGFQVDFKFSGSFNNNEYLQPVNHSYVSDMTGGVDLEIIQYENTDRFILQFKVTLLPRRTPQENEISNVTLSFIASPKEVFDPDTGFTLSLMPPNSILFVTYDYYVLHDGRIEILDSDPMYQRLNNCLSVAMNSESKQQPYVSVYFVPSSTTGSTTTTSTATTSSSTTTSSTGSSTTTSPSGDPTTSPTTGSSTTTSPSGDPTTSPTSNSTSLSSATFNPTTTTSASGDPTTSTQSSSTTTTASGDPTTSTQSSSTTTPASGDPTTSTQSSTTTGQPIYMTNELQVATEQELLIGRAQLYETTTISDASTNQINVFVTLLIILLVSLFI